MHDDFIGSGFRQLLLDQAHAVLPAAVYGGQELQSGKLHGRFSSRVMWALKRKRDALKTAAKLAVKQPNHKAACAPLWSNQAKQHATKAAPMVWPLRRAKAIMPLPPLLRSGGVLDMMALRLGD